MGERGPIPKRSDERHRRNASERDVVSSPAAEGVQAPAADGSWHPIAKRLWRAAKESGQSRFYEPSDWAVLYSLMDDLSYYKSGSKRSGQMLQTIMSSLSSLLLTEGDRRRLQIELARPGSEDPSRAGASEVERWRGKLTAV